MGEFLRKHTKFLTLLILFLSAGTIVLAQDRIVRGQVTSSDDGEGLPGVNIQVEGTTRGTVTDFEGNYSLEIQQGDNVLVYSFIGYKTTTVEVGNRSVIDVVMELDIEELEEIVVVGYGTVRKSDLTGSVSRISTEELVKVPSLNPMQSLQGKVAGVQITNSSGAPGAAPVVRIRGVGTTGNPDPIYVVDGVIVNDINYLNAADIESMEVLKDASATAIYGNRGANGVIIITTKLGKIGEEPSVQISSEFSMQRLQQRIDLLNGRQFAEVVNVISPGSYNNLDAVPNTDWQELLFQDAPMQNHQISLSGASEKNQYYYGLAYFGQAGIIPESKYERVTLKINNRYKPKEFFALGNNLTIAPFRSDNSLNDAPFNVYRAQPVIEPFNSEGGYNEVPGVGNILGALEYNTDNITRGIRTVGNLFAEVYFLEGFTFKSSFGIDVGYEEQRQFTPVYFISSAQSNDVTNLRKRNAQSTSWLWENTLNYDKEFGIHRINAVVGYTSQNTSNEYVQLVGRGLFRTDEDFRYVDPSNIDPTATQNTVDINQNYSMISYLGRFNYSFDGRYLFTATFRRDGSSKFLTGNKYNNFPALALGWNIINEDFFPFQDAFSNLKLRASWGIIGNEKIAYDRAYSSVDNNINAVFGVNEQLYFGQTYGALGNENLRWEEVNQFDIGLELGLFDDKLTSEIDYYNRLTSDILVPLNIPDYLGNGGQQVTYNAAEIRNSGVELSATWRENLGDFNYSVGVVGTTIKNVTEQISGTGGSDDQLLGITNNRTVSRTEKGLPVGAFYGYVVEGVFQNQSEIDANPSFSGTRPGDLIFRDVNGDGVLNGDDRTYLGSSIPDLIYGIQLNGGYKGFNLSVDFQGQAGNEVYNIKETIRPALYNFEQHVYDYWRGDGTTNTEPRPTQGGNNFEPSTRFIQDGDFFRLRNITLSYGLEQSLLERLGLSSVQLYVRGTNVFTFTQVSGYSPEVASGNPLLNGVDLGTYPVSSIYSIGLNAQF